MITISSRFGKDERIVDINIYNLFIFAIVFKGHKIRTNLKTVNSPVCFLIKNLKINEKIKIELSIIFQAFLKYPPF